MLKLYSYFRSSAAYRVRIALNLKKLPYETVSVHLTREGGKQHSDEYRTLNPQQLVPLLVDEKCVINQSIAIIEYLEEKYPTPSILPGTLAERAKARSIAQSIACDIHPLNNLRVLQFITKELSCSEEQKLDWYQHWIKLGLEGIEAMVVDNDMTGYCCIGDTPTLADICLIPQMANAIRFKCPLDAYPTLNRINDYCLKLPAFEQARPENQPDVE